MSGRLCRWLEGSMATLAALALCGAPAAHAVALTMGADGSAHLVSGAVTESSSYEYCRVPAGATACADKQALPPAPGGGLSLSAPAIVLDGATPVVVGYVQVFGGDELRDAYGEVVEWRLPDAAPRVLVPKVPGYLSQIGAAALPDGGYRFAVSGPYVGDVPPGGGSGEIAVTALPKGPEVAADDVGVAIGPGKRTTIVAEGKPGGNHGVFGRLSWTQADPAQAWSGPTTVPGIWSAEVLSAGQLSGGPDGPLLAVANTRYLTIRPHEYKLRFSLQLHRFGGDAFGAPITVRAERRDPLDPGVKLTSVAQDNAHPGEVAVVFDEPYIVDKFGGGRPLLGSNVYARRSHDGGRTFGAREPIGGVAGELTDLAAGLTGAGGGVIAYSDDKGKIGFLALKGLASLSAGDLIRLPSRSRCLRNGARVSLRRRADAPVVGWGATLEGYDRAFRHHGSSATLHIRGGSPIAPRVTITVGVQLRDGRGYVVRRSYRGCRS